MRRIAAKLMVRLNHDSTGAVRFEVEPSLNPRSKLHDLKISRFEHGGSSVSRIESEFFATPDYNAMRALGEQLSDLLTAPLAVRRGEHSTTAAGFDAALEWLLAEARRGQTIQRYKGLGEMNPEQLWETTMDPSQRRLLKVKADDDVAAGEIFSMLMGDQVEPRREFIEKNALLVANLDV
jgi:DNA gyrase subunit B